MAEQKENKIKIEDLPAVEKELSAEEAKKVEGGSSNTSYNYNQGSTVNSLTQQGAGGTGVVPVGPKPHPGGNS
jgi:hypothetical protein